jgi:hypothetical protein
VSPNAQKRLARRFRATGAAAPCLPGQWYLARGQAAGQVSSAQVLLAFVDRSGQAVPQLVRLEALSSEPVDGPLLGYVRSPEQAATVRWVWPRAGPDNPLTRLTLVPTTDCAVRSHPLANVPRWSRLVSPCQVERVIVPPGLEALTAVTGLPRVEVLRPRSAGQLARALRGAACVLDAAWIHRFKLDWRRLVQLAGESSILVSLHSGAELLRRAGLAEVELVVRRPRRQVPAACVECSDAATRGFALQDCFPFGAVDPDGNLEQRALCGGRAWQRCADSAGLTTLLSAPDPARGRRDVLCARLGTGCGQVLLTDIPWLIAGGRGRLIAPRLLEHLLRMQLGVPADDAIQYWHRADDTQVLLRDLSDISDRYPPLQATRRTDPDACCARFSIVLPATDGAGAGMLVVSTGRIDPADLHDGLPPEPLVILMKMLSREAQERSPWAQRYLRRVSVVWHFESRTGLRYAGRYPAARLDLRKAEVVRLRSGAGPDASTGSDGLPAPSFEEVLTLRDGPLGDGSLEFQAALQARLRRWVEQVAGGRRPGG